MQKLKLGIAIFYDLSAILLAWGLAFWLRFNLSIIPNQFIHTALIFVPFCLLIQAACFWLFGLYRGLWHFASIPDLLRILQAVLVGTVLIAVSAYWYNHFYNMPRSVFPMYGLLLIFFLGGARIAVRLIKTQHYTRKIALQRALIVGAGQLAEQLIRNLMHDRENNIKPVIIVDDQETMQGKDIHGIRVKGNTTDIEKRVCEYKIDLVIIALPKISSKEMQRIVAVCEKSDVPVHTIPSMNSLIAGDVLINTLRKVSLEDLLGREPVDLQIDLLNKTYNHKSIVVTGGGGSIGSELCRQLSRLDIKELILIENSEFNLYRIEMELRQAHPSLTIHAYLQDITQQPRIEEILQRHRPQILFHAAAYKHVPMLEYQINVAINNNVVGTMVLANLADKYHVEEFVLISTDKAVNPSNILGCSKRIAEIYCQNFNEHSSTKFITVRFGNVLGSAGSVVPLFEEQLKKGGPLTVTHPEITRYFMTIPEASQLILHASTMGQGGEIYVLDMGEPIKISYLAEQMIKLSGKQPGEDIEIVYTGLRPGEKLHEELFHATEALQKTEHGKIMQAHSRKHDWQTLLQILASLQQAADANDTEKLYQLIISLVPEQRLDQKK